MNIRGKFLTNFYDHKRPDAKEMFIYMVDVDKKTQWDWHVKWIESHKVYFPKATETYTVEQLLAMGMLGLYEKDIEVEG